MVAKSGDRLLLPESINIFKKLLLPITTVLTPNLPEAEILLNSKISTNEEIESSAKNLLEFGAKFVVLKGGHQLSNCSDDYVCFRDGAGEVKGHWLRASRVKTHNTHGTGCTLSSAITAFLARGDDPLNAIKKAKRYLTKAIEHGAFYKIGEGHGPIHHFFNVWKSLEEEDYEF